MRININEHYVLRSLQNSDAGQLQKIADNRNIWINVRDAFPHPYTMNDAYNFINSVMNENPLTRLAIATETQFMGCIGFILNKDIHRVTAELGYWLGEPYWNQGIATLAIKTFVPYGFNTFDITRIQAGVLEWNLSSMRVLEKCGFTWDAVFRKAVIKDGKVCDYYIYSILKDDYLNK